MTRKKGILERNYGYDENMYVDTPNSEYLLDHTYHQYMAQFSMDAMALFEYEGLPDSITSERIEKPLFSSGVCVYTLHKDTKLPIVMPCTLIGTNIYGEATHFRIKGYSGSSRPYDQTGEIGRDGVIIKNNVFMLPTYHFLVMYCKRLSDTELTMDMQLFAMKTPFIIEVDEKNQGSAKIVFDKFKKFEPAIFVQSKQSRKGYNSEKDTFLKVHNTGIESKLMELMNYSHDLQNDLYTRLGINNAMQDKKERMVVDEVNAQKEQIELAQTISYDYRKLAIKQINELFGEKITVKRKGEDNDTNVSNDNSELHDKSKRSD